jgi:hypothetical protein
VTHSGAKTDASPSISDMPARDTPPPDTNDRARTIRRVRTPSDAATRWATLIGAVAGVGALIVALCEAL